MTVTITVQDIQWQVLWSFPGEDNKAFTTMAAAHNVDIPVACGSGACGVCMCKIIQGKDFIEKNKTGEHLIPVGEDELLTCVSGIKTETLNDNEPHEIVLQRMV